MERRDSETKFYESIAIIITIHCNSVAYDVKFCSRSVINLCTCRCNPVRDQILVILHASTCFGQRHECSGSL